MLSKSPGFLSPDRRCLTGNTLKCVGIVTMTIDHLAAVVLKGFVNSHIGLFSEKQLADLDLLYQYMRHIGRTAFPLFVFLLVEGFFHTKDRKGYGLRLLLFAILSEIPDFVSQNTEYCVSAVSGTGFDGGGGAHQRQVGICAFSSVCCRRRTGVFAWPGLYI